MIEEEEEEIVMNGFAAFAILYFTAEAMDKLVEEAKL